MDADLVHSSGEWFAENHTWMAVEADFLEGRCAVFSTRRHFADTDFVTNNFDWLFALYHAAASGKRDENAWLRIHCYARRRDLLMSYDTHSGNSPSTRQTYSFCTCLLRIWCSICRAFLGLLPKSNNPEVNRSNRWIVRKFFRLYSLARMNTTVLCLYRPHGWTWRIKHTGTLYFLILIIQYHHI